MPITGSLISGGAALLGGIMTNNTNTANTAATNASNQQNAQAQMQFQQNMSDTAYQRATKDMEAAGLNPMLAYTQGGATTPSGAMATFQAPRISNPVPDAVQAYNNTLSTNAQVAQTTAQTNLTNAQANNTAQTARMNKVDADIKENLYANGSSDVALQQMTADKAVAQLKQFQANNDYSSLEEANRYAESLGYDSTYAAAQQSIAFRDALANLSTAQSTATITKNQIPESAAEGKFFSSAAGNIAPWAKLLPFVNSATSVGNFFHKPPINIFKGK